MTEKQLARANEIMLEINTCNEIVKHTAAKDTMVIRFTEPLTVELHTRDTAYITCPEWMRDIIENAVIEHRAALYEEFNGL